MARKVELYGGCTVEKALEIIKAEAAESGEECYGEFNGKEIYSTDTVDEAYVKVTGVNKAEHDARMKAWMEKREAERKAHLARVPELIEHYKQAARGVIIDTSLPLWNEILEVRLTDIYRGMELDQTLDCSRVMRDKTLDLEARLRKAYKIFKDAGHSGMSASLTMAMLRQFCPDGNELANACNEFRYEPDHQMKIYIARNTDGKLFMHTAFPSRNDDGSFTTPNQMELNPLQFPDVKPGMRVEYTAGEKY